MTLCTWQVLVHCGIVVVTLVDKQEPDVEPEPSLPAPHGVQDGVEFVGQPTQVGARLVACLRHSLGGLLHDAFGYDLAGFTALSRHTVIRRNFLTTLRNEGCSFESVPDDGTIRQ